MTTLKEDTLDEPTTENKVAGLLEFYIATRINVFNAFHGQETEDDPELLRLEDIAKNAKQEYDKANEAYIKERERKLELTNKAQSIRISELEADLLIVSKFSNLVSQLSREVE